MRERHAFGVQRGFDALGKLPDDVEQSWKAIRDNITSVASDVIGHRQHIRRKWLSAEADGLISLKRETVIRGDHHDSNRYKRQFQTVASRDRELYYNDVADQAEQALR